MKQKDREELALLYEYTTEVPEFTPSGENIQIIEKAKRISDGIDNMIHGLVSIHHKNLKEFFDNPKDPKQLKKLMAFAETLKNVVKPHVFTPEELSAERDQQFNQPDDDEDEDNMTGDSGHGYY